LNLDLSSILADFEKPEERNLESIQVGQVFFYTMA
jgi:hypothetical protein